MRKLRANLPIAVMVFLTLGCGGRLDDSGAGAAVRGGGDNSSAAGTGASGRAGAGWSHADRQTLCDQFCKQASGLKCGPTMPESSQCGSQCVQAMERNDAACANAWEDFLECLLAGGPLTCAALTDESTCVAETDALQDCMRRSDEAGLPTATTPAAPTASQAPIAPDCETIPVRPRTACKGMSSAGMSTGSPVECEESTTCQGHTWGTQCRGSTCVCLYDGNAYCTCTTSTPCASTGSCCP